ncbi:CLUMA_CG020973, isoform A [Clunio marinus]|uniref:CLUMA_CG020973, isoform A n=1 Tax=Clunio marinus TaxID=568069 RepID=A0A1J1J6U7_9DIPT|nr:CLUMA_CG020973, isoform A [Clunio marinus]
MKISTIFCLAIFLGGCYFVSVVANPIQNNVFDPKTEITAKQSGPVVNPAVPGNEQDDDDDDDDDDIVTEDDDEDYIESLFDGILGDDDDDDDEDDDDDDDENLPASSQANQQISSSAASIDSPVLNEVILPGDNSEDPQNLNNDVDILNNNDAKDPLQLAQDQVATVNNNIDPVGNEAIVDDEDDDDDDDDDEDDDDDLDGELIEAKHSRSLEEGTTSMPDIFVIKYNKFVDGIFERINAILKRSYDPVNVHLTMEGAELKAIKKKTNKKQKKNKKNKKQPPTARNAFEEKFEKISTSPVVEAIDQNHKSRLNGGSIRQRNNQTKQDNFKNARATLYGLSSLKRSGNVKVNQLAQHTTIKSNFILGPLMLKVEKITGRNEKREIRMATATTHEIYGKINIRVINGKASLHSIKVQQPKQVKVDAADNHIHKRQYSWEKEFSVARAVSHKLRKVVKNLF